MFGFYRLSLALAVVAFHLSGKLPLAGPLAVFGFYTLSGYLITLTVQRNYLGRGGRTRFFLNRALRIYPTYWACLAVAVLLVAPSGERSGSLNPALVIPSSAADWVSNVVIFGLLGSPVRLLPPAWSLNIELVYYLGLGLFLSRSRAAVAVWLAASIVVIAHGLIARPFLMLYFSFVYPTICFAIGAALVFRPLVFAHGPRAKGLLAAAVSYPAWPAALAMAGVEVEEQVVSKLLLIGSPLFTVIAISILSRQTASGWMAKLDRWAGDVSYPVFLLHWAVATFLVVFLLGDEAMSPTLTLVTSIASIGIATGIVRAVEVPSQRLRDRIRAGGVGS